jgi:hypothetical protein
MAFQRESHFDEVGGIAGGEQGLEAAADQSRS